MNPNLLSILKSCCKYFNKILNKTKKKSNYSWKGILIDLLWVFFLYFPPNLNSTGDFSECSKLLVIKLLIGFGFRGLSWFVCNFKREEVEQLFQTPVQMFGGLQIRIMMLLKLLR